MAALGLWWKVKKVSENMIMSHAILICRVVFLNKSNLYYSLILLKHFLELEGYSYLTGYSGGYLNRYLDTLIGVLVPALVDEKRKLLCNRKRRTLNDCVPIAGSVIIMSQTLFYISETNVSQTTLKTWLR